ncbi:hypothetical protein HDU76_010682, partial [Blyttiomyces sp. JEL0837]
MAGRENTEPDVLDLSLRQQLFPGSTYAFECGGKTRAIRGLTNAAIKAYHARQYNVDNITILLCGIIPPDQVFDRLSSVDLSPNLDIAVNEKPGPIILKRKTESTHSVVKFPSSDDDEVGSITFGWRGPPSDDVETNVAIDVMMRYLQDTSASPLHQTFVEAEEAWASDVDYDTRGFVETLIAMYFSGVPVGKHADEEVEEEHDDGHETDESGAVTDDGDENWDDEHHGDESDEEDEDEEHKAPDNLFDPNVFKKKLFKTLTEIAKAGIPAEDITRTIERFRRKIQEALEDEPHEVVANYLIPDIIRHYHAPQSSLNDARHSKSSTPPIPVIGTRGAVFDILDSLLAKPSMFWSDLIRKWLLDNPVAEVQALPSRALAKRLAARDAAELEERKALLKEDGLKKCGDAAAAAFEANRVDLGPELLSSFPKVPDVVGLPKIRKSVTIEDIFMGKPFHQVQTVVTETAFAYVRIAMNTADVPDNLRPYLVLFQ